MIHVIRWIRVVCLAALLPIFIGCGGASEEIGTATETPAGPSQAEMQKNMQESMEHMKDQAPPGVSVPGGESDTAGGKDDSAAEKAGKTE